MNKQNKESVIGKLKNDVFKIIKTTILDKSIKGRVWFIRKGLC